MAHALHAQDDNMHLAALNALRVIIKKSGDQWFAQGIEIDYAICAETKEKVKDSFAHGLAATLRLHLTMFQSMDRLLKWTPENEWKDNLTDADCTHLDIVTICDVEHKELPIEFPFHQIKFIETVKH